MTMAAFELDMSQEEVDQDDTCIRAFSDPEACISKLPAGAAILIKSPSGTLQLGWDTDKHPAALQRVLSHAESLRLDEAARDQAAEAHLLRLQAEEYLATTYRSRRTVVIVVSALDVAHWVGLVIVQVISLFRQDEFLRTAGIRNQDVKLSLWIDNEGGQLSQWYALSSVICLIVSSVGFALTLLVRMNTLVMLTFSVCQVMTTVMVSISGFSFFVLWRILHVLCILSLRSAIQRYQDLAGATHFIRSRQSFSRLTSSFFAIAGGFLGILFGFSTGSNRQRRQSPPASNGPPVPAAPMPAPLVFPTLTPAAPYTIPNSSNPTPALIGAAYGAPGMQQPSHFAPMVSFPTLSPSHPGHAVAQGAIMNSRESQSNGGAAIRHYTQGTLDSFPASSGAVFHERATLPMRAHATDSGGVGTGQLGLMTMLPLPPEHLSAPWQTYQWGGVSTWALPSINPMFATGLPGQQPALSSSGAPPTVSPLQPLNAGISQSRRRTTIDGALPSTSQFQAAVIAAALDVQQLQHLARNRRAAQLQQQPAGVQLVSPGACILPSAQAAGLIPEQGPRAPPVHAVSFHSDGSFQASEEDDDSCASSGSCVENSGLAVTVSVPAGLPTSSRTTAEVDVIHSTGRPSPPACAGEASNSRGMTADFPAEPGDPAQGSRMSTQEQLVLAGLEVQALRERIRDRLLVASAAVGQQSKDIKQDEQ